jgi:hypothetical protein
MPEQEHLEFFDKMMELINDGYTVSLCRLEEYRPSDVVRVEVRKDDLRHMELVDISIQRTRHSAPRVDHLLARCLHKAKWEFEYDFGKGKTNG